VPVDEPHPRRGPEILYRTYSWDLGLHVVGVDPARNLARAAVESGIETVPKFFNA